MRRRRRSTWCWRLGLKKRGRLSRGRQAATLATGGDTIELTPPLIMSENDIGEIMDKVGASIKAAA